MSRRAKRCSTKLSALTAGARARSAFGTAGRRPKDLLLSRPMGSASLAPLASGMSCAAPVNRRCCSDRWRLLPIAAIAASARRSCITRLPLPAGAATPRSCSLVTRRITSASASPRRRPRPCACPGPYRARPAAGARARAWLAQGRPRSAARTQHADPAAGSRCLRRIISARIFVDAGVLLPGVCSVCA